LLLEEFSSIMQFCILIHHVMLLFVFLYARHSLFLFNTM